MNFLRRSKDPGSSGSGGRAGDGGGFTQTHEPLQIGLNLGNASLQQNDGGWTLAPDGVQNFHAEITRLQQRVASLESKTDELRQRNTRLTERKLLVEFKNQLLTELLAVAQLDAEKNHKRAEEANVKVEALKWELVNLLKGRGPSVSPSAIEGEEAANGGSDAKQGSDRSSPSSKRSPVYRQRRLTPPPRRHKFPKEESL